LSIVEKILWRFVFDKRIIEPEMSYEISVALRTLRNEGIGPLLKKTGLYFRQFGTGLTCSFRGRPPASNVEGIVDYSSSAANGLIRAGQVRSEILALGKRVQQLAPRVVVEIGTATGGTLFIWCALARPDATIVSIDLPGGIHGGGYPYWKTFLYRKFAMATQKLHLLRGNSHDPAMLDQLKSRLHDEPVDFLFIDGDHTYAGVKQDFEIYSPLVRKGGLIAFHDICEHPPQLDCHVDEFWREVKKTRPSHEFIENPKQGWGGIGLIEV
jgi:predicted O-methyltransferase YrrM